eukprot:720306-Prymnesium_polylepis.1
MSLPFNRLDDDPTPSSDGSEDIAPERSRTSTIWERIHSIKDDVAELTGVNFSKTKRAELATSVEYIVALPQDEVEVLVKITLDFEGQHTIRIKEAVTLTVDGESRTIEPAMCNLYSWPKFERLDKPGEQLVMSGPCLAAAELLIFHLLTDEEKEASSLRDAVGATPVHGLLVANTPLALKLVLRLFEARPKLMLQSHAAGPFLGENTMHVVIVNRHEALLLVMIELSCAWLSDDELRTLYHTQTDGPFFDDAPMRNYGGTVLAWVCVFGLRRALQRMLECERLAKGVIDLNDHRQACKTTGFLPVHAVTANGLRDMYDFVTELPRLPHLEHARASRKLKSAAGDESLELGLGELEPLQLTTKLGDH